jgi:hypothetical protein
MTFIGLFLWWLPGLLVSCSPALLAGKGKDVQEEDSSFESEAIILRHTFLNLFLKFGPILAFLGNFNYLKLLQSLFSTSIGIFCYKKS